MKLYTDISGKFQMYIPIDWEYKNPFLHDDPSENTPRAFGKIDNILGAFQISCKLVTDHIANTIKARNEPIRSSLDEKLVFTEQKIETEQKDILYIFSCAVDDHYFFSTYIISEENSAISAYQEELLEVRKVLETIKFIKPEFRNHVIAIKRFELYMTSIAATIDLKNKAQKSGSFIEYIVLSANSIDALLRLSIILAGQIRDNNNEIDTTLIYQKTDDKPIMERTIYKTALTKEIIPIEIFNELEELYEERNKVVHRYIITDIKTEHLYKIAIRYSELENKIDKIVNAWEKKQSELGIGIHGRNDKLGSGFTENELKELISNIRAKHGKLKTKISIRVKKK